MTSSIATDETTLQNDQTELVKLQGELKVASLVNQLEALAADEITALNSLLSEPANTLGVSLVIASPPAAAAAEEQQA